MIWILMFLVTVPNTSIRKTYFLEYPTEADCQKQAAHMPTDMHPMCISQNLKRIKTKKEKDTT
jgi:hypothetical protein